MYSVSSDYINKLKDKSVKRRRIRGTVDNVSFTQEDILASSFKYTDIAVSSADIKLGGVFIGTLSLSFLASFADQIARGTWRGRTISAEIGLQIDGEEDTWEWVPLKPYTIDEANHSALGVEIKAYDAMSKLDLPISMNTTSGNLYGFATLACAACGITLGMTSEQMAALPNGDQILGLYPENDIQTWRDLISWIAATAGGFATINRDGELEFRTWSQTPALTIDKHNRFTGGTWSDFETNYSAIIATNAEDGSTSYYAMPTDNGLTLSIGNNPLLQYGTAETVTNQRRAVLLAIQNLKYTPYKSTSHMDPAFDLGDVIKYTGGLASDESLCCIMRIDYQFSTGTTVQGYGKAPAQNGAQSKADKAINAATSGVKNQGLTYYTFINAEEITLETTAKRIYKIVFEVTEQTSVDIWHEVKTLNTLSGNTQAITYEYYLDGVKFEYEAVDTFGESGYHSEPHPYWLLDVTPGQTHTWEVRAKLDSGTATVAIGNLHAMLKGQKLAATVRFDGLIEITEEFSPIIRSRAIVSIAESITLETQRPASITGSDTMAPILRNRTIVALNDTMRLTAQAVQYTRVLENEDTERITEDGGVRLTEV